MNNFILKYLHLQYSSDKSKSNISKKLFDFINEYYDDREADHLPLSDAVRATKLTLQFMMSDAKNDDVLEELKLILNKCEESDINYIMIYWSEVR